MPLWRIVPVVPTDDDRWLDYTPWQEVLVRSETAALARVVASRELKGTPDRTGNESPSERTGLEDEKLYHVQQVGADEMASVERDGPEEVITATRVDD